MTSVTSGMTENEYTSIWIHGKQDKERERKKSPQSMEHIAVLGSGIDESKREWI